MYRQLEPDKIVATVETLLARIKERFPDSNLSRVASELVSVANEAVQRIAWIQKPHLLLRISIWTLLAAISILFISLLAELELPYSSEMGNFIQILEAGLSALFFIGATIIFLVTWETRIKRQRALVALHELRAIAHIIDMHQLTKSPELLLHPSHDTPSSPKRSMTRFELNRYLDYCSELLSLVSKIAALYIQGLQDPIVLNAVDDIEDLTAELSQKIWQKITLLESMTAATQ